MRPEDLLRDLLANGVELMVVDGKLRCDAPEGVLTTERQNALREHKAAMLDLLRMQERPPPAADLLGSAEVLQGTHGYLIIRSAVLEGEEVIFAGDDAALLLDASGLFEGRAVYRTHELAALIQSRPSSAVLQTIHQAKKEMGGVYLGESAES